MNYFFVSFFYFVKIAILLLALGQVSGAVAQQDDLSFQEFLYQQFNTVESFGMFYVELHGTASDIGFSEQSIKDLVKLRARNNFAEVEIKEIDDLGQFFSSGGDKEKVGGISVRIWTVGDSHPIAYHLKVRSGPLSHMSVFEEERLGYGSRENVRQSIRESINKIAEDLAIAFFKARGDL